MPELQGTSRLCWNPRVAARTVSGEAFILLEGRMVTLNEVGTFIWERCEEGATITEIVAAVVDEFEVDEATAERDARALVAQLLAKGMLAASPG